MPKRDRKLKENYRRLREAGFSATEAARYRGASQAKIAKAIEQKRLPDIDIVKQAARIRPKPEVRKYHKGKIKDTDYKTVKKPETYGYLSKYTYVMSYVVVDKEGAAETKYITITSNDKMTKKELRQKAHEIITKMETSYKNRGVQGSIELVEAYHNTER